jgi:hypothetical protein
VGDYERVRVSLTQEVIEERGATTSVQTWSK